MLRVEIGILNMQCVGSTFELWSPILDKSLCLREPPSSSPLRFTYSLVALTGHVFATEHFPKIIICPFPNWSVLDLRRWMITCSSEISTSFLCKKDRVRSFPPCNQFTYLECPKNAMSVAALNRHTAKWFKSTFPHVSPSLARMVGDMGVCVSLTLVHSLFQLSNIFRTWTSVGVLASLCFSVERQCISPCKDLGANPLRFSSTQNCTKGSTGIGHACPRPSPIGSPGQSSLLGWGAL